MAGRGLLWGSAVRGRMAFRWRAWLIAAAAWGLALGLALALRWGAPAVAESVWVLVVVVMVTGFAAAANVALQPSRLSEERRALVIGVSALALFAILFNLAP